MAVTDANILTGVINICVNKYAEGGPEYKSFYPQTETNQIVDFATATDTRIKNIINNYSGTIKSTNLTATTTLTTKDLSVTNNATVANTVNVKDLIASNSIIVKNGSTNKITLNNNGTVTATTFNGSLSGNATTASELLSSRIIDGVYFKGNKNIHHYGTCGTAATTADKEVVFASPMESNEFAFTDGAAAIIKFSNANTANGARLKIGSTAKPIYYRGAAIASNIIKANSIYTFVYDSGSGAFHLIGDLDVDTHYEASLFATTTTGTANSTTTNGNTALRLIENNTPRSTIKVIGSDATSVTSDNTGTITITSANTKVTQTVKNDNANYPILAVATANQTANATSTAVFGKDIKINPSTNTIIATNFSGTATNATADGSGNNIASTYIKALSVSGQTITYTKGNNTTGTLTTQDTKVTQTLKSDNTTYPILAAATANQTATATNTTVFDKDIKINPSTSTIIATTFSGNLNGNANTATKATQDSSGNNIVNTYATKVDVANNYATKTDVANNYVPTIDTKKITITAEGTARAANADAATKSIYPIQYTVTDSSVTANDVVEVIVEFASCNVARAAGLYPIVQSYAGKFILLTKTTLTRDINILYRIYKGVKEPSGSYDTPTGGKVYMEKINSAAKMFTIYTATGTGNRQWSTHTNANFADYQYRYKYTIEDTTITANDVVDVFTAYPLNMTSGIGDAIREAELCPIVESASNTIYIYAKKIPASIIPDLSYRIYTGTTVEENDDTNYMPKVYTRTADLISTTWTADTTFIDPANKNIVVKHYTYGYKYTISNTDIKKTDVVEIIINPKDKKTAKEIDINPVATVIDGSFTIYAKNKPTKNINISWRLHHGSSADATSSLRDFILKKQINTITIANDAKTATDTINVDKWIEENYLGYNYKYTISNAAITAKDVVELIIPIDQQKTADQASIYPIVETGNKVIYLRSRTIPQNDIQNCEYYVYQGK